MGKPRKQHRKKKYNYDVDRRKLWKKSKKLTKFSCKEVLDAYEEHKSHNRNMEEMGLCMDPNKLLKLGGQSTSKEKEEQPKRTPKAHVVEALEAQANTPQPRRVRMSDPEVRYCIYMIEKYGEDYEAMARDYKNYYQDTANQIRKKIKTFQSIPEQYGPYLQRKDRELGTPPPEPLVRLEALDSERRETRGYCASRRNGHYLTPPFRREEPSLQAPGTPCVSRAKRRLNFGRRPPRLRHSAGDVTGPPPLPPTRSSGRRKGGSLSSGSSAYSSPSKNSVSS